MTSDEKVENLLFVIWIQDQRHDFWMRVVREMKGELEGLKDVVTSINAEGEVKRVEKDSTGTEKEITEKEQGRWRQTF